MKGICKVFCDNLQGWAGLLCLLCALACVVLLKCRPVSEGGPIEDRGEFARAGPVIANRYDMFKWVIK